MSYNQSELTDQDRPPDSAGNEPVLNIAREVPVEYAVILFGYITPIFFVITVVANIIIVLVLSRPVMRTPTNLVLLSMAVADLLTLVFPVPWYFYMYTLGNYRHYLYPSLLCNMYNYMSEVLPAFFHTASIWCTILLACQRYVYICHPTLAKIWCTNRRVTKTICIIFVAAFIHQLSRFIDGHYENTVVSAHSPQPVLSSVGHGPARPTEQNACRLVMADWVLQIEDFYFFTYFLFRIIFVHIGPCLVLVIFNVLLYGALKKAEKARKRLFLKHNIISQSGNNLDVKEHSMAALNNSTEMVMADPSSHCRPSISIEGRKVNRGLGSGRDANSTTFMLIVVVSVFLIVEIPLAITTAVHVAENMFELELVSDRLLNTTIIFSNFFIIISYPLNFAIYCGMSRAFRKTFTQMFVRHIINTSPLTISTNAAGATTYGKNRSGSQSNQSRQVVQPNVPVNGVHPKSKYENEEDDSRSSSKTSSSRDRTVEASLSAGPTPRHNALANNVLYETMV